MSSLWPSWDTNSRTALQDTARLYRFFWSDAFALCSPCLISDGVVTRMAAWHRPILSTHLIRKICPSILFIFVIFFFGKLCQMHPAFRCSGPTRAFAPDAAAIGWEECRSGLRVDVAIGALFQHPLGDSGYLMLGLYHMFETMFETSKMHYAGKLSRCMGHFQISMNHRRFSFQSDRTNQWSTRVGLKAVVGHCILLHSWSWPQWPIHRRRIRQ